MISEVGARHFGFGISVDGKHLFTANGGARWVSAGSLVGRNRVE
jgi:hypothetical protein